MAQPKYIFFNIIKFIKITGLIIINSFWSLQLCSLEHEQSQAASPTSEHVIITIPDTIPNTASTTDTAFSTPKNSLLKRITSAPLDLAQAAVNAARNYLTRTPPPISTPKRLSPVIAASAPALTVTSHASAFRSTAAVVGRDTHQATHLAASIAPLVAVTPATLNLTPHAHSTHFDSANTFAITPTKTLKIVANVSPKEPSLQLSLHEIIKQAHEKANPAWLTKFIQQLKSSATSCALTHKLLELDRANFNNTPLHTAVLTRNPSLVAILSQECLASNIDLTKQINSYGCTPMQLLSKTKTPYDSPGKQILHDLLQIENHSVRQRYESVTTDSTTPISINSTFKYGPEFCAAENIKIYHRQTSEPACPIRPTNHSVTVAQQSRHVRNSSIRTKITPAQTVPANSNPYFW